MFCAWMVIFVLHQSICAQELPPIENLVPMDYGAENQNWSIFQSKEKNVYLANNTELLEFNGTIWGLSVFPLPFSIFI